jgi:mycothiol synthase
VDRSVYSIRPFLASDFEGVARLQRELDPEHAATAEEIRHWDHLLNLEPDHLNLKFTVERVGTGELVGEGSPTQPSFNYDPRRYWIWVGVAPAHRRKGIGAEVFSLLESEARARNALGLWGNTRESDLGGVRFLQSRGFRILRRLWLSRLELPNIDLSSVPDRTASLERDGIRFTTLAEVGRALPEARQRLYHLSQLSAADIPRVGTYRPISFDEFVALELEAPGTIPEAIFLACKDSEIVGMTTLERELSPPTTLRVGFTGIHPNYRGRGIATELKLRAIRFARQLNMRYLVTGNDSMNRPILAINQKLGFRPETIWIQGEKSMPGDP